MGLDFKIVHEERVDNSSDSSYMDAVIVSKKIVASKLVYASFVSGFSCDIKTRVEFVSKPKGIGEVRVTMLVRDMSENPIVHSTKKSVLRRILRLYK